MTKLYKSNREEIDDVYMDKLTGIHDERGWLMEIVRCSSPTFQYFGQLYLTTTYDGAIKAWHSHKHQTDHICCIKGMIKLVLLDMRLPDGVKEGDRPITFEETTHGNLIEMFIGEKNPHLVGIPPGVLHGWKAYGGETAYIVNIPSNEYDHNNPDEIRYRPDYEFTFGNESGSYVRYSYSYDWMRVDK